jgi:glucose/arabinose dehydrogenase/mono/diheme cytochrome c family protein
MVKTMSSHPLSLLALAFGFAAASLPTLHAQAPVPVPAPAAPGAFTPIPLPPADPNKPRAAQQIYAALCITCHGQSFEGNRAPSMLDDVWAHGGEDADLVRSIRDGWPLNEMPGFKAVLSDQEIRGMVVLIREVRGGRPLRGARVGGGGRGGARGGGGRGFAPPTMANPDGRVVKSQLETFKIERVADGLQTPWGIAFLPDGKLLVSERPGRIRIIEVGKGIVDTITGLPPVWVQQDGGLLDIAVHPDFAHNHLIYFSFSEVGPKPGTSGTRIMRARIEDHKLVDLKDLFRPKPEQYWEGNIHYGSRFFFDKDGYLFYSIGERGHRPDAQNLASPYGKLHRIRDDGTIPPDNPFVNTPGADPSVWSYGHRNQQGIAQHPVTGELFATEHGPRGGDELNLIIKGHNYGWPVITYGIDDDGTPITDLTEKEGMDQPLTYWTPSIATAAIDFYTGDKFPKWKNQLFLAALAGQQFRRIELDGHKVVKQEILFNDLGRVREVVNGPDGYLYIAVNTAFGDSPGQIIRLVPSEATPNATVAPKTAPDVPAAAPAPATPAPAAPKQ